MLESDDDLVDTIKEMQEARGRGDKFNPRQLHDKIEVIGPAINLDKLTQSIGVQILDSLGVSWDRWFGMLQKFYQQEGHCRVPIKHSMDGFKLGSWVAAQRKLKDKRNPERFGRLDALGFSWDPISEQWEESFEALKSFRNREGHFLIPSTHLENGIRLGLWVNKQRENKHQLAQERTDKLSSIGLSLDPLTEQWDLSFAKLKKFHQQEGHCRVPIKHAVEGFKLGSWVSTQRKNKDSLKPDQVNRLDALGFSWDPVAERWEESFQALKKFYERTGSCQVSEKTIVDGIRLQTWTWTQRENRKTLSPDQIKRLDLIKFSWDPFAEQWEESFNALKIFRNREGHCRVNTSKTFINGINLGRWVSNQRVKRHELNPDQLSRLESLGFSWDPVSQKWDYSYAELKKFKEKFGHCIVPRSLVSNGVKLGVWVKWQRQNKSSLTPLQVKKLDEVDFKWGA